MTLQQYLYNINQKYTSEKATEHTFRGDLQQLIKSVVPEVIVINEPKRQSFGAPDYILTKKGIPIGFIEAKNIGDKDLEGKKKSGNKTQFDCYKASSNNLIFTDYLDFHLYQDGKYITKVAVAELTDKKISPLTQNFNTFESFIKNFCTHIGQTIESPKKLAEMMAGKARLLSNIIGNALTSDDANQEDSTLKDQMLAFKEILIHDITPQQFADVYAQTIAYGMFAARLHDPNLNTFSRQKAAELIPKSNPFLRKLFGYIAGPDIDDRIELVVDNLTAIFLACDVEKILNNVKNEDPIIHFYETFLSEYDPELRAKRGVWYTPKPVVNFIVRAVDDILKDEFDLKTGLADTTKTIITAGKQSSAGHQQIEQEVHKVQILDPATGTGTFLVEVVKRIHEKFKGQEGIWSDYVENHLIPRLNGFELLMASYAMAHLKLDLLLTATGFKPTSNQRFRVYLTNSLEESHPDTGILFTNWLSIEANEANHIKRDTPVMVVIGNPPYSGESANKGAWITHLLQHYKQEPGGGKLQEKNPKWLNDDYVKFIRYGQHYIDRTDKGVLAYVNNHSFLDNPTFRGMRHSLLKSFDKIYIIDLHGNSKKKETAPDGSPDKNVFDIQQGVSINLFVKTGKKKEDELGKVFHYDLYGERQGKYDFLWGNDLNQIDFKELELKEPNYFFVQKNYALQAEYDKGFSVNKLFPTNSVGIVTARDRFTIYHTPQDLKDAIAKFCTMDDETARAEFFLRKDTRDWKIALARKDLDKNVFGENDGKSVPICYRPFDVRHTYYTGNSKGFHCMPRGEVMRHFLAGENVGLVTIRRSRSNDDWREVFFTNMLTSGATSISALDINYVFPLYLYPATKQQTIEQTTGRTPNLNLEIVKQIAEQLGLTFTNEKETTKDTFAPIDILDYIYAVLHSPAYRQRYNEFLKTDFPRVPYSTDKKQFRKLAQLGGELRTLHLLESKTLDTLITGYPKSGDQIVTKPHFEITDRKTRLGKVHINQTQYFQNVPEAAWNFHIGGYQPAQKYLKDRKGRALTHHDITHYQKIIVALSETERLMGEIDEVLVL